MRRIDWHSIRWRLPMTYAAIAFVAALSLGAVLLAVLNDYYVSQEQAYLRENAYTVSSIVGDMLRRGTKLNAISGAALRNLGFFADIRIQLQDSDGLVIVDSGTPALAMITMPTEVAVRTPDEGTAHASRWYGGSFTVIHPNQIGESYPPFSNIVFESAAVINSEQSAAFTGIPVGEDTDAGVMAGVLSGAGDINVSMAAPPFLPIARVPFGGLVLTERPDSFTQERRSDQVVIVHILDTNDNPLGYVRVFEGPAYGSEILDSVARSWVVASGVAVILAALAGWIMSRDVTAPVLSLTRTTARMAEGDLSVRSHLVRDDEFGKLSASFNEMAHRVENTVLALRRFVADAAHELHTPLTALRTNIELSVEAHDSATLERALRQVERLEGLADSLLDLSRIETNMDCLAFQPVDIVGVLRQNSEIFASRAEQKHITYTENLPQEPIILLGSEIHLERMVENLVDNALKFTAEGGAIQLQLESIGSGVSLIVQDTGIGIPDHDIPYLFERFHRGSNTASYPGSGLGLAIVKAIVDTHQGHVDVTSASGKTTISIWLPTMVMD